MFLILLAFFSINELINGLGFCSYMIAIEGFFYNF